MKLGQILRKQNMITKTQLEFALDYQYYEIKRGNKKKLGIILVSHRIITDEDLKRALKTQKYKLLEEIKMRGKKTIKLLGIKSPILFKLIPKSIAEKFEVFPIALRKNDSKEKLFLAMVEGSNVKRIEKLSTSSGCYIEPVPSTKKNILKYIKKYY